MGKRGLGKAERAGPIPATSSRHHKTLYLSAFQPYLRVLFFCKFSKISMNFVEQNLFLDYGVNRVFSSLKKFSKLQNGEFWRVKASIVALICSIDYLNASCMIFSISSL